jgi:hypothetical protein
VNLVANRKSKVNVSTAASFVSLRRAAMTGCETCELTYDGPEEFPGVHINHLHVLLSAQRADLEEMRTVLWSIATDPLQDAHIRENVSALLARLREGKG